MAARRHRDDIAALKRSVNLSTLISGKVALKKSGRHLRGLCPFHREKTPSFDVDDAKGVYYCRGCGAGGDHVSWLMNGEGVSFQEALERLGGHPGPAVTRPYADAKARSEAAESVSMGHFLSATPLEGSAVGWWLRYEFHIKGPFIDVVRWQTNDVLFWSVSPLERIKPPLVARVDDDAGPVTIYSRNADACIDVAPGLGSVRYGEPRPTMALCASLIGAMWIAGQFGVPCWATLFEHRLGTVQLPDICTELIIFAESGDGWSMALKAADRQETATRNVIVERLGDHLDTIGKAPCD